MVHQLPAYLSLGPERTDGDSAPKGCRHVEICQRVVEDRNQQNIEVLGSIKQMINISSLHAFITQ